MWAGADAGNLHNGYTRQWTVHYGPTLIAHCWPQSRTNDFDSARITLWRMSPAPRNRQRREPYLHAPAKAEYPISIFPIVELNGHAHVSPCRARPQRRGDHNRLTTLFFAYVNLPGFRSEEHTSELQSLMRISYAVFCLKK